MATTPARWHESITLTRESLASTGRAFLRHKFATAAAACGLLLSNLTPVAAQVSDSGVTDASGRTAPTQIESSVDELFRPLLKNSAESADTSRRQVVRWGKPNVLTDSSDGLKWQNPKLKNIEKIHRSQPTYYQTEIRSATSQPSIKLSSVPPVRKAARIEPINPFADPFAEDAIEHTLQRNTKVPVSLQPRTNVEAEAPVLVTGSSEGQEDSLSDLPNGLLQMFVPKQIEPIDDRYRPKPPVRSNQTSTVTDTIPVSTSDSANLEKASLEQDWLDETSTTFVAGDLPAEPRVANLITTPIINDPILTEEAAEAISDEVLRQLETEVPALAMQPGNPSMDDLDSLFGTDNLPEPSAPAQTVPTQPYDANPAPPSDAFQPSDRAQPPANYAPPTQQPSQEMPSPNDEFPDLETQGDLEPLEPLDDSPTNDSEAGESESGLEPLPDDESDSPDDDYGDDESDAEDDSWKYQDFNGRNCPKHMEECRSAWEALRSKPLSAISLDITPTINPKLTDPYELEMDRVKKLQMSPYRTWNNRSGQMIAEGRLVDYRNGRVMISGGDGSTQAIAYASLGDEDMCFLNAWWELPAECALADEPYQVRNWTMTTFTWVASGLCHKPLYFENVELERYGHSAGPVRQTLLSGVHFFGDILFLPYHMGVTPPNECKYALGYYRPGSCAPWLIPAKPLSARGLRWQAAALGAGITLLP